MPDCPTCDGRGAVKVNYHSGEPFDVGICSCQAGIYWRAALSAFPKLLEHRFGIGRDRIGHLEDLVDADSRTERLTSSEDILATAGKVNRAGLGGKTQK